MRALRLALVAALISVSAMESSAVFARTGGANGPGPGPSGGATGGTGGGSGGGHGSSEQAIVVIGRNPPPRWHYPVVFRAPASAYGACFKQQNLYDRYGDPVVNIYGAECFGD